MESPAPQSEPRPATLTEGFKDSLPIVISYIPVAFAFGLNATRLGFTPLESVFFSCIIYAGASQFVITTMLAAGSTLWVAALTVMAMDVRHVLYGPSLRSRISQSGSVNLKPPCGHLVSPMKCLLPPRQTGAG
ncbi:Inner membrane protein YgaZ [Citrobacter koseri]|uniref:Inner membrane protein YgaZ n=1 Tax=Citrobacter koseri TaxID=545 RepID=A0A2X2X286_CITKO|nr:Inner membrane protein YgaZ [Citrobacter koseri]